MMEVDLVSEVSVVVDLKRAYLFYLMVLGLFGEDFLFQLEVLCVSVKRVLETHFILKKGVNKNFWYKSVLGYRDENDGRVVNFKLRSFNILCGCDLFFRSLYFRVFCFGLKDI